MRFPGTWSRYSKNAIPQLTSAARTHGLSCRFLRCAYQAKVMKVLEQIKSRMVLRTGDMRSPELRMVYCTTMGPAGRRFRTTGPRPNPVRHTPVVFRTIRPLLPQFTHSGAPMRTLSTLFLAAVVASPLAAQGNPVSTAIQRMGGGHAKSLLAAAQAMPADKYTFKPTPAQMSFGEIIAHIADDNGITCGA